MKIALLISGGGTTAEAIIRACNDGRLQKVIVALVIASKTDIPGIARTKAAGVAGNDIILLRPKDFSSPQEFGSAILAECKVRGVDFVGQYGWLPQTPANVIEAYQGMITNQHPGPLDPGHPDFGGEGMYGRRVIAARMLFVRRTNREFWTEATAQRVAEHLDEGAVLGRRQVPILPEDTVETLQARLLPEEHALQIETLQHFADGKVKELVRNEPLVRPEEYALLEECKKEAIKLYPHG